MTAAARSRKLYLAEPPAAYLGRPPLVVDGSILVAVLFQEPSREHALRALRGKSLHAPYLIDSEIANVAVKKARRGQGQALIVEALEHYVQHDIELHRPDVQAQYALAMRYGLSACDAAYLWLAGVLQAPLATFDAKLWEAAQAYLSGSA